MAAINFFHLKFLTSLNTQSPFSNPKIINQTTPKPYSKPSLSYLSLTFLKNIPDSFSHPLSAALLRISDYYQPTLSMLGGSSQRSLEG